MGKEIDYAISQRLCDFAFTLQEFFSRGWRIDGVEYGDSKYSCPDRLKMTTPSGDKEEHSPDELEDRLKTLLEEQPN